jgi:hypothetical protein
VTGKDEQIGIQRLSGELSALTGLAGEIMIEIIYQQSDVKSFSVHLFTSLKERSFNVQIKILIEIL